LLKKNKIKIDCLTPITEGASGAYVFNADNQLIIKYISLPDLTEVVRTQFYKEYNFYRLYANDGIDFIPDVIFQTVNNDEMLIVLKKYTAIKHEKWNEDLQKSAMQLCARINTMDINNISTILQSEKKQNDTYPLSRSFENWQCLQSKFPIHIDAALLQEMYEKYDEIILTEKKLTIPQTVCHGDFHPNNFLMYEDKLIICDWQNLNIGRGISDVAFFISRGADMRIHIDRDMLINEYYKAMIRYTDKKIEIGDLYKNIAASEFTVSFRFWAEYLQDSSIERIMRIYDSMVHSYRFMLR
jgi:thiamine kinase-like enzyme